MAHIDNNFSKLYQLHNKMLCTRLNTSKHVAPEFLNNFNKDSYSILFRSNIPQMIICALTLNEK